jgi:hypothetical protein
MHRKCRYVQMSSYLRQEGQEVWGHVRAAVRVVAVRQRVKGPRRALKVVKKCQKIVKNFK